MTNKEKELEDEIERIRKMKKPSKTDIEWYIRCKDEIKGRQEARKELIEEFEKMIEKLNKVNEFQDIKGNLAKMSNKYIRFDKLKQQLKQLGEK